LFGSCLYILEDILPRYGVEVTFVDGTDLAAWEGAIRPDTSVVFFESMSNPTLELIDIASVSRLAHAVGARSSSTTSSPRRSFQTPSASAPMW
jgi:O-succinylhomoserine sulfhydrylase